MEYRVLRSFIGAHEGSRNAHQLKAYYHESDNLSSRKVWTGNLKVRHIWTKPSDEPPYALSLHRPLSRSNERFPRGINLPLPAPTRVPPR